MIEYNVHPYMIASSPTNDYGVVVCPKIFDRPFQLDKATTRIPEDKIGIRNIILNGKTYNIAYKCERIIKPGTQNEVMVDAVGRDLYMHYGFILDDTNIENKPLVDLLDKTKEYLQPYLEKDLTTKRKPDGFVRSDVQSLQLTGEHTPVASEHIIVQPDHIVKDVINKNPSPIVGKDESSITEGGFKKKAPTTTEIQELSNQSSKISSPDPKNHRITDAGSSNIENKIPKHINNFVKISLSVGVGFILVDGVRRMAQPHDSKSEKDSFQAVENQKHRDVFIGAVETAAAITGLMFIWHNPRFERFLNQCLHKMCR